MTKKVTMKHTISCHQPSNRIWARPRHCANPTLTLKLSIISKNGQWTTAPFKMWGKHSEGSTEEIQFSTKITKWNTDHGRNFIVHYNFNNQSRSSEQVRLMLNQACSMWTFRGQYLEQYYYFCKMICQMQFAVQGLQCFPMIQSAIRS